MPKKFQGENTKAASAKERKAAKAAEEKQAKDAAAEDSKWDDDDKSVAKKAMRKEEREKKRLEELQRKQENKLLAEAEAKAEEELQATSKSAKAVKMTQFHLQQQKAAAEAEAAAAARSGELQTHLDAPLMENTNRLEDVVSATGVDQAIRALSVDSPGPAGAAGGGAGRVNMAAAYKAFEERRLPAIKKEYPTLKLSQHKMRIRKEWQKSPDNPLIQQQMA